MPNRLRCDAAHFMAALDVRSYSSTQMNRRAAVWSPRSSRLYRRGAGNKSMAVKDTCTIYVSFTQPYGSNKEADFSFVAHQLKTIHVDANFECVQLRPGENLWERVSP